MRHWPTLVKWAIDGDRLGAKDVLEMKNAIGGFKCNYKISILMPVWNTESKWLQRAIGSVLRQAYPNWELCICDDGSTKRDVPGILARYQEQEPSGRISIVSNKEKGGIVKASNAALSLATGEFVGLLDHDDELTPDAVFQVVSLLQEVEAEMIYSDEDKVDIHERRFAPCFKPDWSPDTFLSNMYTCHFGVYRKELVNEIGGFRGGFDGSQDYDLVLRLTERTSRIFHIPRILYHWRVVPGSAARFAAAKKYALVAAKRALSDALVRRGEVGAIEDGNFPGWYRVRRKISGRPKLGIIVYGGSGKASLRQCLDSLERGVRDMDCEIIASDCGYESKKLSSRIHLVPIDAMKNSGSSGMVNELASLASSCDDLLFMHDDVRPAGKEWPSAMLEQAQRQQVGVVGTKLLTREGLIEHAGLVVGLGGLVGYPFRGLRPDSDGYFGFPNMIRNCSAVSGACFMVRRALFQELGGFDSIHFPTTLFDVDLCLRAAKRGYRTIYTPYAPAYHGNFAPVDCTKPGDQEREYFNERWAEILETCDPYYNPNLITTGPGYLPERCLPLERPSSHPSLEALLSVYYSRPDLQNAFPIGHGRFDQLVGWATTYGATVDPARDVLRPYLDEYRSLDRLYTQLKQTKKLKT
jgi:GT2 family glycosyltransferase